METSFWWNNGLEGAINSAGVRNEVITGRTEITWIHVVDHYVRYDDSTKRADEVYVKNLYYTALFADKNDLDSGAIDFNEVNPDMIEDSEIQRYTRYPSGSFE